MTSLLTFQMDYLADYCAQLDTMRGRESQYYYAEEVKWVRDCFDILVQNFDTFTEELTAEEIHAVQTQLDATKAWLELV